MYIAPGKGQTAPRGQVLMSTEMSCHFVHLLKVSKKMSLNKNQEMRSFKSNENIQKKKGGSYYVVSANKASSVTL